MLSFTNLLCKNMSNMYGLHCTKCWIAVMKSVHHNTRRTCSTIKGRSKDSFAIYSAEQQNQIMGFLQKCVLNNTTRPYLNEKRLQSLKSLFEQNNNIQSLEPLLSVNGIGPKLLHRICDTILATELDKEQSENVEQEEDNNKQLKLPHSLISPCHIKQSKIESVVSIHLGVNAVSWTRLRISGSSEDEVDRWDVMDLSEFVDRKYDVHSIWDLVLQLRHLVPDGDIYVMENNNWGNVANIKKPMKYHIQEAMVTTAICSIFNQTDFQGQPREEVMNRLYFIRTFTPSRLFNKIVGSERVSAQDIVLNMMEGIPDQRHRPITFTDDTAEKYLALNGSLRDNMCRALLLAVSFAELALHKNLEALGAIGRLTTKKKKTAS